MARYAVKIKKSYVKTIIVEDVDDFEEAADKVCFALENGDIELTCDDYYGTEIEPTSYFSYREIPDDEDISWYCQI